MAAAAVMSDGFVVVSRGLYFSIEWMSPVSATVTVIVFSWSRSESVIGALLMAVLAVLAVLAMLAVLAVPASGVAIDGELGRRALGLAHAGDKKLPVVMTFCPRRQLNSRP